jgi:hypothetical protein
VKPRLAVALACALPLLAHAQQVQRTGAASIENYLSKMDADRDGVLSPAEQPGGRGTPLTIAEHRARIAERFGKQDANRDGFLDARELAAPPR